MVQKNLHVELDNIRSAYNVGSIFRTADGTGCTQLHICGISPYPPNPKVEKTALGATQSVKWQYHKNSLEAIETLKKMHIPIYSVETSSNAVNYTDINYPKELALVLGNEIEGICQLVIDNSDKVIQIPMSGSKGSLNVATVAGIIMYEAIRNTKTQNINRK